MKTKEVYRAAVVLLPYCKFYGPAAKIAGLARSALRSSYALWRRKYTGAAWQGARFTVDLLSHKPLKRLLICAKGMRRGLEFLRGKDFAAVGVMKAGLKLFKAKREASVLKALVKGRKGYKEVKKKRWQGAAVLGLVGINTAKNVQKLAW